MMRKIIISLSGLAIFCLFIYGTNDVKNRSIPPIGYTGATGAYCTSCHSDFPLNTAGGGIELRGLPVGNYIPGATYNLSLKIKHSLNNIERWGFSMKAIDNSTNNSVGTLSTTNTEAIQNGNELSHYYPQLVAPTDSFVYTNLFWTAPTTPAANVTFYFVGNATNNSSGNDEDHIYAGTSLIALPISLTYFNAVVNNNTALLKWQTEQEVNSNYFEVERSDDGQFFFAIGKINTKGSGNTKQDYQFTDDKLNNNNATIFYRLRTVDKDGTTYYSMQQKVVVKNSNAVFIEQPYPSIVAKGDNLNIKIKSKKAGAIKMMFLNQQGKILFERMLHIANGVNNSKIEIPNNASSGINFIKFYNSGISQTYSIIVVGK